MLTQTSNFTALVTVAADVCVIVFLYLFYYSKKFYYCCAFYTLVCKALCWKCAAYKTPRTLTPVTFNWRFRCCQASLDEENLAFWFGLEYFVPPLDLISISSLTLL